MALDYKKGKFIFKLTTEKKSEYYFECPDEKEAKLWIDAITAFSQFTEEGLFFLSFFFIFFILFIHPLNSFFH